MVIDLSYKFQCGRITSLDNEFFKITVEADHFQSGKDLAKKHCIMFNYAWIYQANWKKKSKEGIWFVDEFRESSALFYHLQ